MLTSVFVPLYTCKGKKNKFQQTFGDSFLAAAADAFGRPRPLFSFGSATAAAALTTFWKPISYGYTLNKSENYSLDKTKGTRMQTIVPQIQL